MFKYVKAGGARMRDSEIKSDLLAILPDTLRRDLLWHATDGGSFEEFRDMVLAQSARTTIRDSATSRTSRSSSQRSTR